MNTMSRPNNTVKTKSLPRIPKITQTQNLKNEEEVTELEHLRKIFVGGIATNTTEDGLKEFYGRFGNVIDVIVMRDPTTKRSRGFGFVTYSKAYMVDKAQENRPHVIDGKTVDAKRVLPRSEREKREANNVKKIFVGGLKNNHDEECLQEYFSQYGNVLGVKILADKVSGRRRGFAFVEFDDYDAVDKVILKPNHSVKMVLLDVKKAVVSNKGDANGIKAKGGTSNGYQNGQSGNSSYQQQQPQQPMMNNGQPMNYYNGPPMNYNGPPMNYNGPPMNYNNWGPPPQNYGYNQGPPQNWNNWYYPQGNGWNGPPQQGPWNQGWGNNGPMPNGAPAQQNAMGPQQGPMGPQQGQMNSQQGPISVPQQGNMGGPQQGNMGGPQQGNMNGSQQGNMGGPQQGNMGSQQQGNMGGSQQGNMGGQPQGNMGGQQQGNMGGPQQGNMGGSQQGLQSQQQGIQGQQSGVNNHQQVPEIWNSGTQGQNSFGNGYQQNYGGGPKKGNDLSSNRMNPYSGPSNNYGNNQQQGYNNGYNNSGLGPGGSY